MLEASNVSFATSRLNDSIGIAPTENSARPVSGPSSATPASFGRAYNKGEGGGGANSRGTNPAAPDGAVGTPSVTARGRTNSNCWIDGAAYQVGPYTIAAGYRRSEQNQVTTGDKGRLDQGNISGSYQLGPGIRLVGGIFAFDADGEGNGDPGGADNDGWGGAVAFKLGF